MKRADLIVGEVYGIARHKQWLEWGSSLKPAKLIDIESRWRTVYRWSADNKVEHNTFVLPDGTTITTPDSVKRSENSYQPKDVLVQRVDAETLEPIAGAYYTVPAREVRILYAEGIKALTEHRQAQEKAAAAHRQRVADAQTLNAEALERLTALGLKQGGIYLPDSDFSLSSKYSDAASVTFKTTSLLRLLDEWAEDKACLAEVEVLPVQRDEGYDPKDER